MDLPIAIEVKFGRFSRGWRPFKKYFLYVDDKENTSAHLFIKHNIRGMILYDVMAENEHYIMSLVRIKDKDKNKFLTEMIPELDRSLQIKFGDDYLKFLNGFWKNILSTC